MNTCPYCGERINDLFYSHPKTRRVWKVFQDHAPAGQTLQLTQIAALSQIGKELLYYHLNLLIDAGYLEKVPKCDGGLYHVYRINLTERI